MPAKKQITREKILSAGVDIIRRDGESGVNTLSLAKELNCSTQPIYLSFKNIGELKEALREEAEKIFLEYISKEIESGKYPEYKAYGMAYVLFAMRDKNLFSFLFLRDRKGARDKDESWSRAIATIKSGGVSDEKEAERIQLNMWIYVHGIAAMCATGYVDFSEEEVATLITDNYRAVKELKR